MNKTTIKSFILSFLKYLLVISFAISCIYPLVWLFFNSLKTNQQLFDNPWNVPLVWHFENYYKALITGNIARSFLNSVIVTFFSVTITILLSTMAAYGVTRLKWKLSKLTLSIFLLGIMVPTYSTIIPLFDMFNKLHLINNYLSVIIPYVAFGLPIAIFVMSGFYVSLPHALEEAAMMDGCSVIGTFFKIIFPVSLSPTATVAVIAFLSVWNDLLFPQIFLSDSNKMTLPVSLMSFSGRYSTDYVSLIAAVVITIIPTVMIYVALHDKIIEGMTAGAVKG
jgi:raffinose/stachyose/melibiose transport system permease protein